MMIDCSNVRRQTVLACAAGVERKLLAHVISYFEGIKGTDTYEEMKVAASCHSVEGSVAESLSVDSDCRSEMTSTTLRDPRLVDVEGPAAAAAFFFFPCFFLEGEGATWIVAGG